MTNLETPISKAHLKYSTAVKLSLELEEGFLGEFSWAYAHLFF